MPIETFTYHFKAYTISNKIVSKVSVQKKGEKSYEAANICSNFGGIRCSPLNKCTNTECLTTQYTKHPHLHLMLRLIEAEVFLRTWCHVYHTTIWSYTFWSCKCQHPQCSTHQYIAITKVSTGFPSSSHQQLNMAFSYMTYLFVQ